MPSGAGVRADHAAFCTLVHSDAVLLIAIDSISAIGPTLAEFRLETLGEAVQDPLSVAGPLFSGLLILDDDAADFPVRVDHDGVDRLPGPVPGRGEDLADSPVECARRWSAAFRSAASEGLAGGLAGGFLGELRFFGAIGFGR